MACLGVEPGAAGWKAQTNPLSYGGTPFFTNVSIKSCISKCTGENEFQLILFTPKALIMSGFILKYYFLTLFMIKNIGMRYPQKLAITIYASFRLCEFFGFL